MSALGLSVTGSIEKYALPHQQDLARLHSNYPYPGANGSELCAALKNAALNCDETAVHVLLRQLKHGMFGQSERDVDARLACIKEARREIKKVSSSDSQFDFILGHLILRHLESAKNFIADRKLISKDPVMLLSKIPMPEKLDGGRDPGWRIRKDHEEVLRMAFDKKYICDPDY